MQDFLKVDFSTWTTDPGMAARYAPIHGMVTELLNRTDPDGYTNMLESLLAERKPESIGEAIRQIFAPLGGVDLKIPPRRGAIRDPGIR